MKKFPKMLALILVCILGLSCAGCAGNDPDSATIPLYGTRVLYRPDSYDYDKNTENADYYGQYAQLLLDQLLRVYGTSSYVNPTANRDDYNKDLDFIPDETKPYFYDSVRYQLTNQQSVLSYERFIGNETTPKETGQLTGTNRYVRYTAETGNKWNWSFGYNIEPKGLIYHNAYSKDNVTGAIEGTKIYNNFTIRNPDTGETNDYMSNLYRYYVDNNDNRVNYTNNYLVNPTPKEDDITKYSSYVKALEYVIYCMNMEIEPKSINVTYNNGLPVVDIDTFEDVDSALKYVKEVFAKRGNIVGITPNKQKRLSKYILDNIIGENAISNDTVNVETAVRKEYYEKEDESGNLVNLQRVVYEPITGTSSTITVNRDYNRVVSKVVENATKYISIGGSGDDYTNEDGTAKNPLDETFVSSSVIDYYQNYMFISTEGHHEFDHIPAMEYQSMCLMFSEDIEFANLQLHFKYDAGENGDYLVDRNASLTVRVYINVRSEGVYMPEYMEQTITIPDGGFCYGEKGYTINFFGLNPKRGQGLRVKAFEEFTPFDTPLSGPLFDIYENATVGALINTLGLNKVFALLETAFGYQYKMIPTFPQGPIGEDSFKSIPIPVSGTSSLKDYYKLVASDNEELGSTYYSYGILNEKVLSGDFFEIAFEVVKATGENSNNYKFQVGLGLIA